MALTGWLTIPSGPSHIRSGGASWSALAGGSATVGQATGGFGVSKPAISKRLKILEEEGMVLRTVEGRTHRLSLDQAALTEAGDCIERQRSRWERLFDVVDEYLKEERT